jgi:IS4 transposase
VVRQGSDFIIRLNWANVPMMDENRKRFDLLNALRGIPEATVSDFNLRVRPDPKHDVPALPVRVVAVRKSEAAAAESRKKILKTAARRQRNVDPRALELAAYVLVITSLEADRLPSEDVLEIYRFRWQIELAFKRLKSLLDLDGLPAKDPSLASTFIYSKILAALLLDDLTHAFISFSPWGFVIQ